MKKISIGLSTSSVYPLKLEETFRFAKEVGYDGVEIMVTNDQDTQDPEAIKRLMDKYDLPVLSIHAPVLLLTHFVWGRDPELKLWKSGELARNVGASSIVVHPPFSWQNDYSKNFLKIINSIETLMGVQFCVENMFPWRVNNREMKAYAPSWDVLEEQSNKLTLDFSHAALSGLDSLDFVKRMGSKVGHIHLCDGQTTLGSTKKERKLAKLTTTPIDKDKVFDEHLPPGRGDQPVAEVLQYLVATEWEGSVVAEVNTRRCRTEHARFELLKETLQFAQNIIQ